jgi:hypothetical protein
MAFSGYKESFALMQPQGLFLNHGFCSLARKKGFAGRVCAQIGSNAAKRHLVAKKASGDSLCRLSPGGVLVFWLD